MATLRRKMQGYYSYYGVVGNSERITRWYHEVTKLVLFKWLNRRSRRHSFTWATFSVAWESWQLPAPKITEARPPRSARQRAVKPAMFGLINL
jgi:RNA-directed DNA polymerase